MSKFDKVVGYEDIKAELSTNAKRYYAVGRTGIGKDADGKMLY